MKKIFFIFVILQFASCTKNIKKTEFTDILYLKNGEEYLCNVEKVDEDRIIFITDEGKKELKIKDITGIDFGRKREGSNWKNIKDIDDEILKNSININLSEFQGLGYINIYYERNLMIEKDSNYTYTVRIVRGIVDENGREAGNLSFYYRKKFENISVEFGRTITKEGEVLHIRDNAIEDASVYSRFPIYENLHEIKFALNKCLPGNFIDFKVKIKGRFTELNPYILDEVMGDKGLILNGLFKIRYPEELNVNYEYFNTGKPSINKNNGYVELLWEFKDIPPLIEEPNLPPYQYFLPRIVFSLRYEWKEISNKFKEKMKGEIKIEKNLFEIYKELLKGIKFLNIPLLSSNVFPNDANDIMKNKIANSLDKSFLFYLALKSKGLPADLILVRSRDYGTISENVPSLLQFDGALVYLDGKYYDLSYETMPFQYIRNQYQWTKGLSIEKGELINIPIIPLEEQKSKLEREVKILRNGDSKINDKWIFKGDDVLYFRELRNLKKEEIDIFVKRFINSYVKDAEIENYKFSFLDTLNNIVQLDASYNIKNLGIIQGKFMLLNIPGINYSAYSVGKQERYYPLYLSNISRSENNIRIMLPKGYKLRAKPDDITLKKDGYSFIARIKQEKNYINYYDRFENIVNIISVREYPEYRECIMNMAKLSIKWIILEEEK